MKGPPQAPVEGAEFSAQIGFGPELRAAMPISAAVAQGRWHWRIFEAGTARARALWVRPDGTVRREYRSSIYKDGIALQTVDEFGVEQSVTYRPASGVWQRRLASGELSLEGCHQVEVSRDEQARQVSLRCLSAAGVERIDHEGCSLRVVTLDEHGLEREVTCHSGPSRTPVTDKKGIHRLTITRDALGTIVEQRYFGISGQPARALPDGCHGVRFVHDAGGDITSRTCLGPEGKPTLRRGSTVSTTHYVNDPAGCVIEESFSDEEGHPTLSGQVGRIESAVGTRCELRQRKTLRLDGQLTLDGNSVAVREFDYDEQGRRLRMRCFNEYQVATNCYGARGTFGALNAWSYDERGRVRELRGLHITGIASALHGSVPHVTRTSYDAEGRISSLSYYDTDGRPAEAYRNVGQELLTYDGLGMLAEQRSVGWNGAPAEPFQGCHAFRHHRDAQGRRVAIECLPLPGKPLVVSAPWFESIGWPAGAVRVEIGREPTLRNVFLSATGKELRRVDCLAPEASCYL